MNLRETAPKNCLVCGDRLIGGLRSGSSPNLRGFGTKVCRRCKFEVIDPIPTESDIAAIYTSKYRLHDVNSVDPWRRFGPTTTGMVSHLKRIVQIPYRARFGGLVAERRPRHGACVLEIGFGAGTTLEAMNRTGWRVHGAELSSAPIDSARTRMPGGDFRLGAVDEAAFAKDSFELVLMYHVLEHVEDPGGLLKSVERLLEPGGRLMVAVPNRRSVTRRLMGSAWYGYQLPEHLAQYDERSMRALLERAGLMIVATRPQFYVHALADSILNRVDPTRAHRKLDSVIKWALAPAGVVAVTAGDAAAIEIEATRAAES